MKRIIQYNLHKHNYRRNKLVIKDVSRKKGLVWCRGKRQWRVDWRHGIFSYETKIMMGHDERIWRKGDEGLRPDLLQKKAYQNTFEVMI